MAQLPSTSGNTTHARIRTEPNRTNAPSRCRAVRARKVHARAWLGLGASSCASWPAVHTHTRLNATGAARGGCCRPTPRAEPAAEGLGARPRVVLAGCGQAVRLAVGAGQGVARVPRAPLRHTRPRTHAAPRGPSAACALWPRAAPVCVPEHVRASLVRPCHVDWTAAYVLVAPVAVSRDVVHSVGRRRVRERVGRWRM